MPTLDWIGQKAVVNHHRKVPFHLLEAVPELSCGDENSGNILIQGDNLVALKALLPYYAGKVKCIYIDHPYNTGNESWVYNELLNLIPLSEKRSKNYKNLDNDNRGAWASVDLTGQTGHATAEQFYKIISPNGVKFSPPRGRCWAMAERAVKKLIEDNRIWFGKNGNSRPRLSKVIEDEQGELK